MAGPGMISLKRTERYSATMFTEIMSMKKKKHFMDFRIIAGGREFPCHKLIVSVYSGYLKSILTSDMVEAAKHEIKFEHISPDIMTIILAYIYCGDVDCHSDQLMDLIEASSHLQMEELTDMCVAQVPPLLQPDIAIPWWKIADKLQLEDIKKPCEEIMADAVAQISHQTDFLRLSHKDVEYYISSICGDHTAGDDVLDAVMRWLNHHADSRLEHMENLLGRVQLEKCSIAGIRDVMKTYDVLLNQQPMLYKLLCDTLVDLALPLEAAMVIGGEERHQVNRVCWKVNEANLEELYEIPFGNFARQASVCKIPHGFAITGGVGSGHLLCLVFIASTRSWFRLQDMLTKRFGHGSVCMKGVLYVLGGYVGDKTSCTVHSIEVENGAWEIELPMTLTVKLPNVAGIDDSVYLLDTENTKTLLEFNIKKKVWSQLAALPVEENCHGTSMTSARGLLYVAGGWHCICAWYDPTTDAWCMGKKPLLCHHYGALVCHKKKLVLLGGSCEGGTDKVEEYNMDEGTWSECSYKMPKKLYRHHALVLDLPPRG